MPSATATPAGTLPTSIVSTTSFVAGSMRERVRSARSATHNGVLAERHRNRLGADGDRRRRVRARVDARHRAVARVRNPDRISAVGDPRRTLPDADGSERPVRNRRRVEARDRRLAGVRDPDRAARHHQRRRLAAREPGVLHTNGRGIDARERRVAVCGPDGAFPDRDNSDARPGARLQRRHSDRRRQSVELRVDLGELSASPVRDPQRVGARGDSGRRAPVERHGGRRRSRGRIDARQGPVVDVSDPHRPEARRDRSRPDPDGHLSDDLVRRRVDHADVVRTNAGQATRGVAPHKKRRESDGHAATSATAASTIGRRHAGGRRAACAAAGRSASPRSGGNESGRPSEAAW